MILVKAAEQSQQASSSIQDGQSMPEQICSREWHIIHLHINTTNKTPSIYILVRVTHHFVHRTCSCKTLKKIQKSSPINSRHNSIKGILKVPVQTDWLADANICTEWFWHAYTKHYQAWSGQINTNHEPNWAAFDSPSPPPTPEHPSALPQSKATKEVASNLFSLFFCFMCFFSF